MSFHAGQTFTFGEQPSATKWQWVWDNDYALQDWTAFSNDSFPAALIADGSIPPEKLDTHIAIGSISASASGSVTGLAFQPKSVEFVRLANTSVVVSTYGIAVDNGGSIANYGQGTTSSATGAATSSTYSIINPTGNGSVNVQGAVTAFNSDGFDFTMTTTAAVNYLYIARA